MSYHDQMRTDLALEASERLQTKAKAKKLTGVEVLEERLSDDNVKVTTVMIQTKNAAHNMGKPMGTYITMEVPELAREDISFHEDISSLVAKQVRGLLSTSIEALKVLVIGLGNRAVTADALGPKVIDHLSITRHILNAYGKHAYMHEVASVSSIEPGVMAKTGIETCEIVAGVVEKTKPNLVIVVDALAARSTKRLYTTIQITDTGIAPGSGVGNHRNAINEEVLGVPVLAIGIPTVVDAATIVKDACEKWWQDACGEESSFPEDVSQSFYELKNMYVTTKEIDEIIERVSYTISEGLNQVLHPMEES
ncbi:MAG: GPR endopeptidase [Lachnospiraceae bacterium]